MTKKKKKARVISSAFAMVSCVCTPNIVVNAEIATETDVKAAVGEVLIDCNNFPDDNFREYVQTNFDTDENGSLSDEEIYNVYEINVNENNISSLQGLEYFYNLIVLDCYSNKLSDLDIEKNARLEALYCSKNKLTSLDVSKNTQLKYLYCYENDISSLDVSNNPKLEYFSCEVNNLTSLDVSNNTQLEHLSCASNDINKLDISNNTKLTMLSCGDNNISSLDASNNSSLDFLDCSLNTIKSLEISHNSHLMQLYCDDNELISLNLNSNPELVYLSCAGNKLDNLDLSKNSQLEKLLCHGNNISKLDLSKNPKINYLVCAVNNLSVLDLSNNTALENLYCEYNKIEDLDLSKNCMLKELDCSNNKLINLDVTFLKELKYLDVGKNSIEAIDLSKNNKLEKLYCERNSIQKLDISNCSHLKELFCDDNLIYKYDFSKNNELEHIGPCCTLDANGKYDLSAYSWINIKNLKNINIEKILGNNGDYHSFWKEGDNRSFISGDIVNIINNDYGTISFINNGIAIEIVFVKEYVPLTEEDIKPGIFVVEADRNHYVAGVSTICSEVDKDRLEYLWMATDSDGKTTLISDWSKSEWIDWTPDKFGTYEIFANVRVDGIDTYSYTTTGEYDYHPLIKGKCQMPYSGEQGVGYLIGVESYENPDQKYQYEMLILDCTLLAQGLPAWTYTTGQFRVPEGNAGWCIWTPQYGYYWTLFRVYDENGVLIDEQCYGFANIC